MLCIIGSVALSPSLSLYSTVLPIVPSVCDLGVTVNSNLTPSAHVVNIVAKAHKCALAIHRSCVSSGDVHLLVRAHKTLLNTTQLFGQPLPFVILRRLSVFSGASLKSYKGTTKVFHTLSA